MGRLVESSLNGYYCSNPFGAKIMALAIRESSRQDTLSIIDLYKSVRARTMQIVSPLEIEDYVIQTADFMSPPRWHIGHTSWFFETLLQAHQPGYKVYSGDYLFYFNSYYEGFSARKARVRARDAAPGAIGLRHQALALRSV